MYTTYGDDFSAVSTFPEVHPDVYLEFPNGQTHYDPNQSVDVSDYGGPDQVANDPRVADAMVRLQSAIENLEQVEFNPWPWAVGALALILILRR